MASWHGWDRRTFADTLKANADRQHGTAFRACRGRLAADMEQQHREHLRSEIQRIAAELRPRRERAIRLAELSTGSLVAAAGELATRLGVTGWPEGEATRRCGSASRHGWRNRATLATGGCRHPGAGARVRTAHQYTRFAGLVSTPTTARQTWWLSQGGAGRTLVLCCPRLGFRDHPGATLRPALLCLERLSDDRQGKEATTAQRGCPGDKVGRGVYLLTERGISR